jgi:GNAT superfamily N-acetyltransferase
VSTHTTLEADPYDRWAMSVSGAGLKSIRPFAALIFFERFAAPIQGVLRRVYAWGAFEGSSGLIGAAALARVSGAIFGAQVTIAPERRRLGIGAESLDIAIREATDGGGRRLIGSYPACAIEPRGLVESHLLSVARQVKHGQTQVVLFIAEVSARTQGGQT